MTLEHYKAQEETARQFKELQDQLAASRALCERLQAQADEMRSGSSAPAGDREAVEVVGWRHSATGNVTNDAVRASTWIDECIFPLMTVAQHERILTAQQRTQAMVVPECLRVQVCKLGRRGAAFDAADTHYAYTYTEQPDNVGAMRLGRAAASNGAKSHGDGIDRGLHLLQALQSEGFGVFQIAAAPTPEPVSPWISVEERLPEPNTQVLAFYVNSHGKGRRVRAEWIARHTVEASDDAWGDGADYYEATDTYYSPAGWYECVDNWDELAYLFINEGPVTHWMPLQAAPTPTNGDSHD